ncbi:MAG: crotonase/enoyl-CoA hydratase family protein [Lysobacterales bacterium]|jgi:enoyl-CoA hydratase/carnithine racemase
MNDRVLVDIQDRVAHVHLNRPDKMNALDPAMFEAISETGQRLKSDTAIRAVVLSGEGRAFCAGLDMASFAAMASGAGEPLDIMARTHGPANIWQHAGWLWRELEVPVIAALHGVVFGGGLQVALGADMRYAAPGTRLSVMEIKWGLVPDMAGTQLMRHLAGDDVVRELTFTGREFTAEEAVSLGLVTRVCQDPAAAALEIAARIARSNPDAIRAAKRMFNAAPYLSAEAGLLMESEEQAKLLGSPNQREAVLAEMQGREPVFEE